MFFLQIFDKKYKVLLSSGVTIVIAKIVWVTFSFTATMERLKREEDIDRRNHT